MKKLLSQFIFSLLLAALLAGGVGCQDEYVPDPPTERAELTARLFDALRRQKDDEALRLIEKLQALAPEDADLAEMYNRVVVNRCTRQVQIYVDKGDLAGALKVVQDTRRQYPAFLHLRLLESGLYKLVDLKQAANALAAAKSSSELAAALVKAEPLAAAYPDALQLKKDIEIRRSQLKKMRELEAAAARNAVQDPAKNAPQVPAGK